MKISGAPRGKAHKIAPPSITGHPPTLEFLTLRCIYSDKLQCRFTYPAVVAIEVSATVPGCFNSLFLLVSLFNLGGGNLLYDLTSLVDQRKVDFSVCSAFHLLLVWSDDILHAGLEI